MCTLWARLNESEEVLGREVVLLASGVENNLVDRGILCYNIVRDDSLGGEMKRFFFALMVAVSVLSIFQNVYAGEPGTSGFVFLRLGNGARASGMGEAFTAISDDATGIYFNPAGLAGIEGVELNVTHSEWLMGIRFEQLSFANEMFGGTVGLNFTGVYYGKMDRYENYPSLTPDGTFSPYDLAFSTCYGTDILPNLSIGASLKMIYEKIDFESATGWALDIGLLHKSMIKGLTLGASILNLGPQAKFVEEKFYPPFQLRVGASYRYANELLKGSLILASDAVFPNDSDAKLHLGLEYNYRTYVSMRVGYKANYYVQGATMGIGVQYQKLRFDYAYMPLEYSVGNSHRFSLSVFFPGK